MFIRFRVNVTGVWDAAITSQGIPVEQEPNERDYARLAELFKAEMGDVTHELSNSDGSYILYYEMEDIEEVEV